jgi:HEAT repeat protein
VQDKQDILKAAVDVAGSISNGKERSGHELSAKEPRQLCNDLASHKARVIRDSPTVGYEEQRRLMFVQLMLTGTLVISQAGVSGQREIAQLIETLTQGEKRDWDAYMTAVDRLVALGQRAVPPLMDALASKDERLRAEAAGILGKIGDPAAIPGLAKLVKEGDTTRVDALRAIGQIGGAEAATVIMAALAQQGQQEWGNPTELIPALRAIGDRRAIEPLGKILEGKGKDSHSTRMRILAAEALGRFRDPRARQFLRRAIAADPEWEVYRAATLALDEMNEYPRVRLLRQEAIFAVEKQEEPPEGAPAYIRRWREELKKEVQSAKDAGLPDPSPPWIMTVGMFATKIDIERAGDILVEHTRLPGGDPAKDVVELLMEYLTGRRKIGGSKRAQALIIRIGRPAVPSLLNGLKRGIGYRCAKCLAEIGDPRAIQPLKDYAAGQSQGHRKRIQALIDQLEAGQKGKSDGDK